LGITPNAGSYVAVAGATVTVYEVTEPFGALISGVPVATATTNANGEFTLNLYNKCYLLRFNKAGYQEHTEYTP